jgi:large subunit ribosomal protein L21
MQEQFYLFNCIAYFLFWYQGAQIMYAIVKTGGLQYKVQPGDTVTVNKLDGEIGSEIMLNEVLMVVDPQQDSITVGRPLVSGTSVSAEIIAQKKGDKIIVFRSRRRTGFRKKNGHRQLLTQLKIKDILV